MTARPIISVTFAVEPDGGVYTAVGRCAWALKELIRCQDKGITSIENPAPRLAAYVFKLKKLYGLVIETVDEKHGGPYSGCHGRYFLRSQVKVLRETEALS